MAAELNHTIVWCSDNKASSAFLAHVLGRPDPVPFHHFMVVELDNGVSLDFMTKEDPVSRQHYAFLITEEDFDGVLERVRGRGGEDLGGPGAHGCGRDQSQRRRAGVLFRGSGRARARGADAALRGAVRLVALDRSRG